MNLTFSKTLLATMVFAGLTACSSGGGGGSSEPTTSSSSASNESITVPTVQDSTSVTNSNSSNSTSTVTPNQNNTTSTLPMVSTFRLDPERGATGIAIYKGGVSTLVNDGITTYASPGYYDLNSPFTGELTLVADFDQRTVKGNASFDIYNKTNTFLGSEKVGSAEITLEEGKLSKYTTDSYRYDGIAKGAMLLKDEHIPDLKGRYNGNINSFEGNKFATTKVELISETNQSINLKVKASGAR